MRRGLAAALPGRTLLTVIADPRPRFASAAGAAGRQVADVRRRGKFLLLDLADRAGAPVTGELVVHLGMTGVLSCEPDPQPSRHVRLQATLDDGRTLRLVDPRGFGRTQLIDAGDHAAAGMLGVLGPEPDDPAWTPEAFLSGLHRTRVSVKGALLSQKLVAGPGNIYVDEALWRAGVHPGTPSNQLSPDSAAALRAALIDVLAEGVAHGGTTLRDYRSLDGSSGSHQQHLDCYGRDGLPCHRCRTPLARAVVAGRGTTLCPSCQPQPTG